MSEHEPRAACDRRGRAVDLSMDRPFSLGESETAGGWAPGPAGRRQNCSMVSAPSPTSSAVPPCGSDSGSQLNSTD